MTEKAKDENSCVLRFFGADADKVRSAAEALAGVEAQCASRGGETLLALRADTPQALARAEKSLRAAFKNDLYGRGEQTLPAALVAVLESRCRLLACADADTGALLERRMEIVEGAARVFDFGAMSYAQAETHNKIEQRAARRARGKGAAELELARVQAAMQIVGAELVAGSVRRGCETLLILGTRKKCWLRRINADENPALWLMDMVRRAACCLKQAEGTSRLRYGAKIEPRCLRPAEQKANASAAAQKVTVPPSRSAETAAVALSSGADKTGGHAVRCALVLLAVLVLVCLAGCWYVTGGDFSALPKALGFSHQLHSGASLV